MAYLGGRKKSVNNAWYEKDAFGSEEMEGINRSAKAHMPSTTEPKPFYYPPTRFSNLKKEHEEIK